MLTAIDHGNGHGLDRDMADDIARGIIANDVFMSPGDAMPSHSGTPSSSGIPLIVTANHSLRDLHAMTVLAWFDGARSVGSVASI